jgi:hypothetical protein
MLLKHKPHLESRNEQGQTALLRAVYEHDEDSVRVLLRAGASMQARTKYGSTALTIAVRRKAKAPLLNLLLGTGQADVFARDCGKTAMEHALASQDQDIVGTILAWLNAPGCVWEHGMRAARA